MDKKVVVTQSGLKALEDELEQLKTVRRKEVSEKIRVARSYGDLSENSEYDEAKNEQGLIEQKINEIEYTLKHAKVASKEESRAKGITVGSHVVVVDEDDFEEAYDIVGVTEFDPFNNKISTDSAIGAALVGHKEGDVVNVQLPTGAVMKLTVKKIS